MILGLFETLLSELAKELHLQSLTPDATGSCLLLLKNKVKVQIEPDKKEGFLLIGTTLEDIPLGRYRTDLFEAALKENGTPPLKGIFSWSNKNNVLFLYERLPMDKLNGTTLLAHIQTIADKAHEWKEAIEQGRIPEGSGSVKTHSVGFFGL